jgi:GNAT superfamily N-acetyltransferase
MPVRQAQPKEVDLLATLWFEGWRDAHEAIVPAELTRRRTLETFQIRMAKALPDVRVIGPVGTPQGFHFIKDDELNQFYLAASARGSGVASPLMADAEQVLASRGVKTAWLACAIGNARAARFYEKSGWHRARTITNHLETPDGVLDLDVWRYEKQLLPT